MSGNGLLAILFFDDNFSIPNTVLSHSGKMLHISTVEKSSLQAINHGPSVETAIGGLYLQHSHQEAPP